MWRASTSRRVAARAACATPAASRSARSSWSWARPNSPRRTSSCAACQASATSRQRRKAGPPILCRARCSSRSSTRAGSPASSVGADLARDVVGQTEPGGGQGVGRGAHPLGQVQVVDRPVQVVGRAPPHGPGDQLLGQPPAQLHGIVVVGHIGPAGQRQRLVEAPRPRGLLRLSQHDSPMSQHD